MANDFDQFPIDDEIVKGMMMSPVWSDFLAYFFENLIGYLSQFGMFVPELTSDQRDSIQTPGRGQFIYNTTLDAPQIFQAGVWKTFTTT